MERIAALPRPELLQVADAVARDKGIDRDEVLEAMEQAIQKAGRSKYGHEHDIRAHIDRKTGEIQLARFIEVVEEVENEATQLPLARALKKMPGAKVGDFIVDPLPPIDFGRIAAQTAKQVIVQKVREAERALVVDAYRHRVGEILSGVVKKTTRDGLVLKIEHDVAPAGYESLSVDAPFERARFDFVMQQAVTERDTDPRTRIARAVGA